MVYGQGQQLEYDFVVKPGADPSVIKLGFTGAQKMELDEQGQLRLHIGGGDLVQPAPTIYQETNGARQIVSGDFQLNGTEVSFRLGSYDRSKPVVIDPVLVYSTYLGGSDVEVALGIAVDSSGNAYITGSATSSDFPTTPGAFQTTNARNGDAFITKLNASGTALVYSTFVGGSDNDLGNGITVDSSGNAYITGSTSSTDFPTTSGAFQRVVSNRGAPTAFVTKLNASGSSLLYSTLLGGSQSESGNEITVDNNGNAYLVGYTGSSDFPTTQGAFQTTFFRGFKDRFAFTAFVTKLNASGSALIYSTFLGGSNYDFGFGIAIDSSGNAFVTGATYSNNFPTTSGAFQTSLVGSINAFVTKLNAAGNALLYSTYLGGSGEDGGNAIVVDSSGNAYIAGQTRM